MLTLHSLPKGSGKTKRRKGRGNASGAGNYSGRGMKGQRSRSGGKGGLKLRGLKQTFKSVPKKRGFTSPYAKAQPVNLSDLESHFESGATVDTAAVLEKGLVTSASKPIKLLGQGELTKSLTVQLPAASKSAIAAIEKAGGTFTAAKKTASADTSAKKKAEPKNEDAK